MYIGKDCSNRSRDCYYGESNSDNYWSCDYYDVCGYINSTEKLVAATFTAGCKDVLLPC